MHDVKYILQNSKFTSKTETVLKASTSNDDISVVQVSGKVAVLNNLKNCYLVS